MNLINYIAILSFILFSCNEGEQVEGPNNYVENVEVYLLNSLNDSRGYCIDMKGYKSSADTNKELQAHTCYSYRGEISVDQGFNNDKIINQEFYISYFDVCMESENLESSSKLNLRSCDKSESQKFILQDDGKIQPTSNLNLCLTVSESFSEGGGGSPKHLIRSLSLENCSGMISSRQEWGVRKTN